MRPDVVCKNRRLHFSVVPHYAVAADTASTHERVITDDRPCADDARADDSGVRKNADPLTKDHGALNNCGFVNCYIFAFQGLFDVF